MASHSGHHSPALHFMPLPGPVNMHTLPHSMLGSMNMLQPQQYLAQGLAGWHPYGIPQFSPQFQHHQPAWNFYGAAQQMNRTARTNAVPAKPPAKPATRDVALPAHKPPLLSNPTESRTVQVPKPQYGTVQVPKPQYGIVYRSMAVPKQVSSDVQSLKVPYYNHFGQVVGYGPGHDRVVKSSPNKSKSPRKSEQAQGAVASASKYDGYKELKSPDKSKSPEKSEQVQSGGAPSAKQQITSTVQIPKSLVQIKHSTQSARPAPQAVQFDLTRTIQAPKGQAEGIRPLVEKPCAPVKAAACPPADQKVESRGPCGACHENVLLSQRRTLSEGIYYHEDCFNTLMEAVEESKKKIKEKMIKLQNTPSDPKAVELTKTVQIAKSDGAVAEMPLMSQQDPSTPLEKENSMAPETWNLYEVRGCCATCQKPVTAAMPRTAIDGVYYHQECYDSMKNALQVVKVQGRKRYSAAVCARVFETIPESPSPRKTPGGSNLKWNEDDESSPAVPTASRQLPPLQEEDTMPAAVFSPSGVPKGACGVCQKQVYDTQQRCRSDDGVYMHLECFENMASKP